MSTFNLPSSIALSNPENASWNSIVRASTVNSNNPSDTSTKVHWAAVGSSGATDLFFELNASTNVVTVDVNSPPTGGSPTFVSKTGYGSNGHTGYDSITVSDGDRIYMWEANNDKGDFEWQGSWVTAGNTNTEGGASGVPSWSASFIDNGNGTMAAYVNGSPSSAFGVGFNAQTFKLREYYAGALAEVGTLNFVDSTSTQTMYVSVSYDSGKGYQWYNETGGYPISPTFGDSSQIGSKKVHCNFW